MRILGIDYGTKRVGVAVSSETGEFALPLTVIKNSSELVREIGKLAIDHETRQIVLGESRNYKGEPNAIYDEVEALKKSLEAENFNVDFEPEFMTSMQAERIQGKNSMTDASAAALILQSYLDRRASEKF
ncbi:MAG: Holliday junction resolvase RuvX [Patescibacteria group bacterium]|nr:Holliday junction resolvase RuvX [Patescibacteria group bacterium]MDE2172446.1 Holliday junction resolvase RuvX [Patescibacteria group bacterium]